MDHPLLRSEICLVPTRRGGGEFLNLPLKRRIDLAFAYRRYRRGRRGGEKRTSPRFGLPCVLAPLIS